MALRDLNTAIEMAPRHIQYGILFQLNQSQSTLLSGASQEYLKDLAKRLDDAAGGAIGLDLISLFLLPDGKNPIFSESVKNFFAKDVDKYRDFEVKSFLEKLELSESLDES